MSYEKTQKARRLSPAQELAADRLQNARQAAATHKITLRRELEQLFLERGEVFEKAIVDAVQKCVELGMSKAAIMRAYGTSDYRTVANYIERVVEQEQYFDSIAPARFTYQGVSVRGEIELLDETTGETGVLYVGEWKKDWEHNLLGVRGGKLWLQAPELEVFVEAVERGKVVPAADVHRLEAPIRDRIIG